MVHLGQHQTNEAKITQSPPNRLGRTLIDKTSNTVLLINASYDERHQYSHGRGSVAW